jgi:hypothetical protein
MGSAKLKASAKLKRKRKVLEANLIPDCTLDVPWEISEALELSSPSAFLLLRLL